MKKNNIKIGVIGCGTVGSEFIKTFSRKRALFKKKTGIDFSVIKVFDKNASAKGLFPSLYTRDIKDITSNRDIDIAVELIGGIEPAYTYIKEAISKGKSVVTANKALLSDKGTELFSFAEKNSSYLGFEASVASAIPIVKSLRESFIGSDISKLIAILNGTTNYILTQMSQHNENFSKALLNAQKAGYAEANPSFDIEGSDTAQKLSILTALSFGKFVSWKSIFTEGISKITPVDINFGKELGYRMKLLAIAKKRGEIMELRVHPAFIPVKHMLSTTEGVYNAIYLEGDMLGKSLMFGEGAGGSAAASMVISDVIDIGQKIAGEKNDRFYPMYENKKLSVLPVENIATRYYLRFTLLDKPGIFAKVADVLGKNEISIGTVIQKEENKNYAVPVVILTHAVKESAVQNAIAELDKLPIVKTPTVIIRIEE